MLSLNRFYARFGFGTNCHLDELQWNVCIAGGRGQNLWSFKQPIIVTVCCLGLDRICHRIFEHCWHNKDHYECKVDVVNPELKVIKPHLHYMTKFKVLNGKELQHIHI